MYIKNAQGYYLSDGTQCTRKGLFLILLQNKAYNGSLKGHMRAIVRKVALRQLGHFMMGFARVKGERLIISGSYGSDGLPMSVSEKVYNEGLNIPDYLFEAWNKGEGWNSAGSEADLMRKWALENLTKLYNVKGRK